MEQVNSEEIMTSTCRSKSVSEISQIKCAKNSNLCAKLPLSHPVTALVSSMHALAKPTVTVDVTVSVTVTVTVT
jgi:hypothetical protein